METLDKIAALGLIVVVCCAAGCLGYPPPPSPYVSNSDDVVGRASRFEHRQKTRSVAEAIERMQTDPTFTAGYQEALAQAKAAKRRLPVLAIKPILNNTGDGRGDAAATKQIFEALKTGFRKTGLFEIVDYTQRKALNDTLLAGADSGDDDGALQAIGNYRSPNLVLTGEIRRDETDETGRRVYFHFLNLEIQSTATGTVFWSDTIEVAKQLVKRGSVDFFWFIRVEKEVR